MIKILLTGANGQLGRCVQDAAASMTEVELICASREQLDITNTESISYWFEKYSITHCINAAAYTNVEQAESDKEQAFLINSKGAQLMAEACKANNAILLHISTDYVFDGTKTEPYLEEDEVNPINVYGASKLAGELEIQRIWEKHFIVRTSWLYSQYGHNFYRSMQRMGREGRELSITIEQTGTPTNANDLGDALLAFIRTNNTSYGLYHFSNEGTATWYDFAKAIFKYTDDLDLMKVKKTDEYRTFAARPAFSVMDLTKIKTQLSGPFYKPWETSLQELIIKTN